MTKRKNRASQEDIREDISGGHPVVGTRRGKTNTECVSLTKQKKK